MKLGQTARILWTNNKSNVIIYELYHVTLMQRQKSEPVAEYVDERRTFFDMFCVVQPSNTQQGAYCLNSTVNYNTLHHSKKKQRHTLMYVFFIFHIICARKHKMRLSHITVTRSLQPTVDP